MNNTAQPISADQERAQFDKLHPFAPAGWFDPDRHLAELRASHAIQQNAGDPFNISARITELEMLMRKRTNNPATAAGTGITPPLYLNKIDGANVFVVFGQVSGITPTGVAENINVSGTDGTWSIYLDCTLGDDGVPTAVDVLNGTSGVPDDATDHAYRLIGEADVSSGAITAVRPSLMFSQDFVTCGRDATDPETTPGAYYFQVS